MTMKKQKEEITTIPELAKMINRGFQNNQDYMDKKFGEIDERFEQVDKRFEQIDKRFDKVETKLDDFVEEYKSEKLPMRVEYIENILNLPKK